jgi:hypothetical protein
MTRPYIRRVPFEGAERNRQNGKTRIASGKFRHYKRPITILDTQELCKAFPKFRKALLTACINQIPLHSVLESITHPEYVFKRRLNK